MDTDNDEKELVKFAGRFFGKAIATVGALMIIYCEASGCRELRRPDFNVWDTYKLHKTEPKHSHTLTYLGIGVTLAGTVLYGACEEKKGKKEDGHE